MIFRGRVQDGSRVGALFRSSAGGTCSRPDQAPKQAIRGGGSAAFVPWRPLSSAEGGGPELVRAVAGGAGCDGPLLKRWKDGGCIVTGPDHRAEVVSVATRSAGPTKLWAWTFPGGWQSRVGKRLGRQRRPVGPGQTLWGRAEKGPRQ
ncbi:hypothetical protein NDU88_001730 [Pleurodeles waltl]|uniref:Uncharacterized protein n=1 Tax=Pleurodeles waltl TaxID=8319 RepID=A0AAV7M1B6_PLEWA|nr:hypothetical protein NDU88_001730 [Pleurodeles waltl]